MDGGNAVSSPAKATITASDSWFGGGISWLPSSDGSSHEDAATAMDHVEAATDAMLPVVRVLRSFATRVAPETLPKALVGFNVLAGLDVFDRPKSAPQLFCGPAADVDTEEMAEMMAVARRCMRFASVAYGRVLVAHGVLPVSASVKSTAENLCAHLGVGAMDVQVPHEAPASGWLHPAHFVAYDAQRREIIVAVRGTLSVEDVVTDLGADEVELFVGGWAHGNILRSAGNVLRHIAPALERLAEEAEVNVVTFTGHSLGGGVAAYLALLFEELIERKADGAANFSDVAASAVPEVRCVTFGAPGVCSLETARSLRGRVLSVCNGEDLVPRLSFGHVVELHGRALEAADWANTSCQQVYSSICCPEGRWQLPGRLSEALQLRPGGPRGAGLGAAGGRWGGGPGPGGGEGKLYPAGRTLLLSATGAVDDVDPADLAPYISLGGGREMFWDHSPRRYEEALDAAAAAATAARATARLRSSGRQPPPSRL